MTGDAKPGAIVEDAGLRRRRRQQAPVARHPIGSRDRGAGLGARRDMDRPSASSQGVRAERRRLRRRSPRGDGPTDRSSHRTGSGSTARSEGHLRSRPLNTLRRRELDETTSKLSADTGLAHRPSAEGEHVSGIYRQRVTLASGRFAMIDDGLGFQLVPWRPALEQRLGQQVSGTLTPRGGRLELPAQARTWPVDSTPTL